MLIQDMDIVVPNQLDERRIEVLADGLPFVPRSASGRGHNAGLGVAAGWSPSPYPERSGRLGSRSGVKVVSGDCTLSLPRP